MFSSGFTACPNTGGVARTRSAIHASERDCTDLRPLIGWVIVGSESGPRRRPMEHAWAESLAKQCQDAGVKFFMKQQEVDGKVTGDVERFPLALQVRQFPVSP